MARGQGSLSDAEAEVLAIEHQLREYAREKQEHEASRALHTKLMSQVHSQSCPLSRPQQVAIVETLARLEGRLESYEAAHVQRQHAIRKLAERISTLRASKCAIAAN